jgi:hypothetical protein
VIVDRSTLMSVSTVSYEQTALKFVWKYDEDTLRKSPSLKTLNAYLIKNATQACNTKSSWRGAYFFYLFSLVRGSCRAHFMAYKRVCSTGRPNLFTERSALTANNVFYVFDEMIFFRLISHFAQIGKKNYFINFIFATSTLPH